MHKLIFIFISFTLVACSVNPDGYLKRSANNKLIDTKGFNAKKRRPIYNKKYINQAKKNVSNNDLIQADEEQDDLSELEDTYKANTQMYQRMIDQDNNHKLSNNSSIFSRLFKTTAPKSVISPVNAAKSTINVNDKQNNNFSESNPLSQDLLTQVTELKLLLNEAKNTLASIQQEQAIIKSPVDRNINKPARNLQPALNKQLPLVKTTLPKQAVDKTVTAQAPKVATLSKTPLSAAKPVNKILSKDSVAVKSSSPNTSLTLKQPKKMIKKKIAKITKKQASKHKPVMNISKTEDKK